MHFATALALAAAQPTNVNSSAQLLLRATSDTSAAPAWHIQLLHHHAAQI